MTKQLTKLYENANQTIINSIELYSMSLVYSNLSEIMKRIDGVVKDYRNTIGGLYQFDIISEKNYREASNLMDASNYYNMIF